MATAFFCSSTICRVQLPSTLSLLSAERYAILMCLRHLEKTTRLPTVIYTNSHSDLKTLATNKPQNIPIVLDILVLLYTYNATLKFCWLPGHSGIQGNDLVYHAARIASIIAPDVLIRHTEL